MERGVDQTGDPLAPMRANMEAFYRLIGERAAGASVLRRDGVLAAIVPSCPGQSVVNGVVYDDVKSLRAAREEFEAAYLAAGVRASRVWVPERDRQAAELLERAGHRLAVAPRAMTLDLLAAESTRPASSTGGAAMTAPRSRR